MSLPVSGLFRRTLPLNNANASAPPVSVGVRRYGVIASLDPSLCASNAPHCLSSGINAIDQAIGGGYPLQALTLILPHVSILSKVNWNAMDQARCDTLAAIQTVRALIRGCLAEGVQQEQPTLWMTDEDPESGLSRLPVPCDKLEEEEKTTKHVQNATTLAAKQALSAQLLGDQDKLDIAWRYQNLPKVHSTTPTTPVASLEQNQDFCHSFDWQASVQTADYTNWMKRVKQHIKVETIQNVWDETAYQTIIRFLESLSPHQASRIVISAEAHDLSIWTRLAVRLEPILLRYKVSLIFVPIPVQLVAHEPWHPLTLCRLSQLALSIIRLPQADTDGYDHLLHILSQRVSIQLAKSMRIGAISGVPMTQNVARQWRFVMRRRQWKSAVWSLTPVVGRDAKEDVVVGCGNANSLKNDPLSF